jgi:hypothetical protein
MTDVSETFSVMLFEPPYDEQDIGGLEVETIPWDYGKGKVLTVDLALFFLVLLAETERLIVPIRRKTRINQSINIITFLNLINLVKKLDFYK